jgi:hypothetical protein
MRFLQKLQKAQKNVVCQPAPRVSGGNWRAGAGLPLGVRGLIPNQSPFVHALGKKMQPCSLLFTVVAQLLSSKKRQRQQCIISKQALANNTCWRLACVVDFVVPGLKPRRKLIQQRAVAALQCGAVRARPFLRAVNPPWAQFCVNPSCLLAVWAQGSQWA